jgi:acetylornithine deacetylase/succinyl-diaminopimelate desuccinylase-like protein
MSISTPAERLEPVLTWIEGHRDAALADLQRFCRQPSISAQSQGMREMAQIVAESLRDLGVETSLVSTQGFPVVAGRLAGVSTRRLAIYDHYDVQPPEPVEAWSMPPFEAAVKDGRLYARGVADTRATWLRVCGPCGPGARCMKRCHVV